MKRYIRASRGKGFVGIWWYTDDGKVWGVMKSTDNGVKDGDYIQYSDKQNHASLWSSVVKDNVEDKEAAKAIINKGYKSIERGRVIYSTLTMSYTVICSEDLVNNMDFREAIIDYYNLSGNPVDFTNLNHYYKVELTGNPEVDKFNYGI